MPPHMPCNQVMDASLLAATSIHFPGGSQLAGCHSPNLLLGAKSSIILAISVIIVVVVMIAAVAILDQAEGVGALVSQYPLALLDEPGNHSGQTWYPSHPWTMECRILSVHIA